MLKELGAERAVLSRELSLNEIAVISRETGMELETFVHGALCYCYSGQCLFSSILGGRSWKPGALLRSRAVWRIQQWMKKERT